MPPNSWTAAPIRVAHTAPDTRSAARRGRREHTHTSVTVCRRNGHAGGPTAGVRSHHQPIANNRATRPVIRTPHTDAGRCAIRPRRWPALVRLGSRSTRRAATSWRSTEARMCRWLNVCAARERRSRRPDLLFNRRTSGHRGITHRTTTALHPRPASMQQPCTTSPLPSSRETSYKESVKTQKGG